MKPAPVVIKKYGNRRLYDSSNSKYVNLDDIAGFIREGKEVQVVDAKTGQDLTRVTLTQIITEDAKEKPTGPAARAAAPTDRRLRRGAAGVCNVVSEIRL